MSPTRKSERRVMYQLMAQVTTQSRPSSQRIRGSSSEIDAKHLRRDRLIISLIVLGILLVFALLIWQAMVGPSVDVPDYYHWMP